MRTLFLIYICLSSTSLAAMFIGNPAEPRLLKKGIFCTTPTWWSFRVGYLDDWVFDQAFHDEFKLANQSYDQSFMKFSTYAASMTVNICNRLDVYAIVGSSRMQIDKEIFTKRALGWGVGMKLILFKHKNLFVGTDLKYFESAQKPKYFVIDGEPYNVACHYRLKFDEIQAALGVAYRIWMFSPYANLTYILSHAEPEPAVAYVRMPVGNDLVKVSTGSIVNENKWGTSVGLTLIDFEKVSLAVEWRAINQNAMNVSGELRF